IDQPYSQPRSYPADFHVDQIEFFREPYKENDNQAYSLTGTYRPADNWLILTWNRDKADDKTKHEVRYAFVDIHAKGWAAAELAPNGLVSPPAGGAYNHMLYDTKGLPLADHSVVYLAVKPLNSPLFSQIMVPLKSTRSARRSADGTFWVLCAGGLAPAGDQT